MKFPYEQLTQLHSNPNAKRLESLSIISHSNDYSTIFRRRENESLATLSKRLLFQFYYYNLMPNEMLTKNEIIIILIINVVLLCWTLNAMLSNLPTFINMIVLRSTGFLEYLESSESFIIISRFFKNLYHNNSIHNYISYYLQNK